MKQTQSFTEGKIFGPLIRFALPVLLALLLQTMYGAVDLLIGRQWFLYSMWVWPHRHRQWYRSYCAAYTLSF